MAARQREALTLGCVTGIGKFGRQLTVPLFGGYHRRTARWAMGLRSGTVCDAGTPYPPGYFGCNAFGFSVLQWVVGCKILNTNGLCAKSFLSMSYAKRCLVSRGVAAF